MLYFIDLPVVNLRGGGGGGGGGLGAKLKSCKHDFEITGRVLHAFWLKGGGGDFEVKEGHPDFLQIT